LTARARRLQQLQRQLDALDLGRRLGAVRTRLMAADGRLRQAVVERRHRADRLLRGAAARLESLSPLAVLGRGYAVCWNADRTTVIREAAATQRGDRVRVTLGKGELECQVTDTDG
jgi:exodeoxyribonuclease VII large subunit